MSDVVMALRKEKPAARIRFIEGYSYQLADWLQSGRLDVALLYGAQSYAFVETRITVREQLFIVGRPGDVVVVPDTIPFCQLEGLRIISPDLPSTTRSRLEEIAEGVGIALSYDLRIDSIGTIKALAATGFGYAVLPRTAVADEISQVLLDLSGSSSPMSRSICGWRSLAAARSGAISMDRATSLSIGSKPVSKGEIGPEGSSPPPDAKKSAYQPQGRNAPTVRCSCCPRW